MRHPLFRAVVVIVVVVSCAMVARRGTPAPVPSVVGMSQLDVGYRLGEGALKIRATLATGEAIEYSTADARDVESVLAMAQACAASPWACRRSSRNAAWGSALCGPSSARSGPPRCRAPLIEAVSDLGMCVECHDEGQATGIAHFDIDGETPGVFRVTRGHRENRARIDEDLDVSLRRRRRWRGRSDAVSATAGEAANDPSA